MKNLAEFLRQCDAIKFHGAADKLDDGALGFLEEGLRAAQRRVFSLRLAIRQKNVERHLKSAKTT